MKRTIPVREGKDGRKAHNRTINSRKASSGSRIGKMIKVRVFFKNPIDKESSIVYMKPSVIENYRKNKSSSPYKSIKIIK